MANLKNISNLRQSADKLFGDGTTEVERLRKDLLNISLQLRFTQNLIKQNEGTLKESVSNQSVITDILNQDVTRTSEKIISKEKLSSKEAEQLVDLAENTTSVIEGIKGDLKLNIGKVVTDFGSFITDARVEEDERKNLLNQLTNFLSDQSDELSQTKELTQLQKIANKNQISGRDTKKLNTLLNEISKQNKDKTLITTVKQLNNQLDSGVLTQKEVLDTFQQTTGTGETFRERFLRAPSALSTGQVEQTKQSAISVGLEGVIPGLGSLVEGLGFSQKLSDVVSAENIGKTFAGKFGGKVKSASFVKGKPESSIDESQEVQDIFTAPMEEQKEVLEEIRDTNKEVVAKLDKESQNISKLALVNNNQLELQKTGLDNQEDQVKALEKLDKTTKKRGIGGFGRFGLIGGLAALGVTLASIIGIPQFKEGLEKEAKKQGLSQEELLKKVIPTKLEDVPEAIDFRIKGNLDFLKEQFEGLKKVFGFNKNKDKEEFLKQTPPQSFIDAKRGVVTEKEKAQEAPVKSTSFIDTVLGSFTKGLDVLLDVFSNKDEQKAETGTSIKGVLNQVKQNNKPTSANIIPEKRTIESITNVSTQEAAKLVTQNVLSQQPKTEPQVITIPEQAPVAVNTPSIGNLNRKLHIDDYGLAMINAVFLEV